MKKKAVLLSLVCSIVLSGCGGCGKEVTTEVIESESVVETSVGYSEEESTVIEEETTVEETTIEETTIEETTIEEETTETTVEEETVIETTIEETTEAVAEVVEPAEQAPQNSQPPQDFLDALNAFGGAKGSGATPNAPGKGDGHGDLGGKQIVLH